MWWVPDMMVRRPNHSLAVVQGRLVVIGGYQGQGTETTSKVEVLRCPEVGLPCLVWWSLLITWWRR